MEVMSYSLYVGSALSSAYRGVQAHRRRLSSSRNLFPAQTRQFDVLKIVPKQSFEVQASGGSASAASQPKRIALSKKKIKEIETDKKISKQTN